MKSRLINTGMSRGFGAMVWVGDKTTVHFADEAIGEALMHFDIPFWIIQDGERVGIAAGGNLAPGPEGMNVLGFIPGVPLNRFGDERFCHTYRTRYAYYAGAMANGIASEAFVIALGKEGFMGTFGAGGLSPARIEAAIQKVKAALPDGPYAFNLLNSPNERTLEAKVVELYLQYGIKVVEASAYLDISIPLVHYRAAGLSKGVNGEVLVGNRIIAKLSRLEMAKRFLEPAAEDILGILLKENKITPEQAGLAIQIPMADDITVEADSGGHTDNRPLVCMIPAFLALRDELQSKYRYAQPVRIGAAGGIGTPSAALAAYSLGAAYVVTGSINQACSESGTSGHTRIQLAQMEMADVAMAPSSDMFEMGVRVQVLKRGTMFSMRAQKLYDLYTHYDAWEEISESERDRLEKTIFKRDFESIWNDTVNFFKERDPSQIERGMANPKDKMALVFRWYLGLSSRWSISGEKGREMDYQVWCGPSMGAFNNWVKGTYLESPQNRHAADVARHILLGCAYLYRIQMLENQGVEVPEQLRRYVPVQTR